MHKPFYRKAMYCSALDRSFTGDLRREMRLNLLKPQTIHGYERLIIRWEAYCKSKGICDLPADPNDVLDYMLMRVEDEGASYPVIMRLLSALNCLHVSNRYEPVRSCEIRTFLKDLSRKHQRKAAPCFTQQDVHDMCAFIRDNHPALRAARDVAMILLAWTTAQRPSEYSSAKWEHIQIIGPGSGARQPLSQRLMNARSIIIKIPVSKGDQEGRGQRVGVKAYADHSRCAIKALGEWARLCGRETGYIFPRIFRGGKRIGTRGISTGTVWQIVRGYAGALETRGRSPYGFRRGRATHLRQRGVTRSAIQELLRQQFPQTTDLYIDEDRVRWSDNPGRGFLE